MGLRAGPLSSMALWWHAAGRTSDGALGDAARARRVQDDGVSRPPFSRLPDMTSRTPGPAQVDILTNALTTLRRQSVKSVKQCRTMRSPQFLSETTDISWLSERPS
jgi:hypothetical protein